MKSPEQYLEQLKKCVLEVIDSDQLSNIQLWEIANYYEQAKLCYLEADVATALIILQHLRTLPETDTRLGIIRARSEGYSDAIQASSNSGKWAGSTQTQVSAPLLPASQVSDEYNDKSTAVPGLENAPQKTETIKRTHPPINDV